MSNTEAPLLPQLSKVSSETVEKATQALLKWKDAKSSTQKAQLLEQDDLVYLVLALKKIPQKGRTNPYKINLPHPLTDPVNDSSELCLIIDDRTQSHLTKEDAVKKIEADSIPIKKVLKLTKLRTDYRPFEAKRKLCNSYDMFFADTRIIPLLPRLLGKQFFQRKKIPIPVNLKHKNWKEQIEKACSSGLLYLRTGTCCVVKVGKLSMGIKEITENAINAINGISEIVPGQWGNIRSFHLKLADSLPLPLYQTVPSLKLKIESKKDVELAKEIDQKKASKDKNDGKNKDGGSSNKKKKKGRIHEVQYMDSNVSEMLDEDEMDEDSEKDADAGEDSVNVEMESAELGSGSKKRKKGAELKSGKPTKKVAKEVKKDDAAKQSEDGGNAEMESGSKKRKKGAELKSGKPTKKVVKESKKEDAAKQSEDSVNDELESGSKKRKKGAVLKSVKPTKTVVKEAKQSENNEGLQSSQPLKKTTKAKKDDIVKQKKNTDQIKVVEETTLEKKTKAKKVADVPQEVNSEVEKRKPLKKTKELKKVEPTDDSKDSVKQKKPKKGGEQSEEKKSAPKKAKSIGVKVNGKKKKPVA